MLASPSPSSLFLFPASAKNSKFWVNGQTPVARDWLAVLRSKQRPSRRTLHHHDNAAIRAPYQDSILHSFHQQVNRNKKMSVPSRRWQNSKSPEAKSNASLQSHQLSANVKSYLGLQAMSCSLDTCPEGEPVYFSTSPKSISPLSASCTPHDLSCSESTSRYYYTTNTYTNREGNSSTGISCSDITQKFVHTTFKPTIALEDTAHEAPQTKLHRPQSERRNHASTPQNHRAVSSAAKFRQEAFTRDFSSEIEIDADLDDIDSYMMSVYMNEDCSVYSKGTASTVSTSSSSMTSNRSRHRGASHKRRAHAKQAEEAHPQKESGFLRSMKESSSAFFVEGTWSEKYGWYISKKWDATPGDSWDQPNPIFDKEDHLVDI